MFEFIKYKVPDEKYVKFQRLIMGWLAVAALFTQNINLVLLFFGLTLIGTLTGTAYSPVSLFYKLIKKLFSFDLVNISEHHSRYYQINKSVDLIDHLLRIVAAGGTLILFELDFEVLGWGLMAFLSIFMMLSAYFGFCLSALSYIFLQSITTPKATTCSTNQPVNKNCILASHCFTPYKRCDSCHVGITECLGTKFNTVVLIIGLALAAFLFVDNHYFIQLNIVFIIGLIFWLGYQINYSTDDLAQSNNKNIELNQELKAHMLSLEAEVQKRTSEIKHLVIHDQLTGVYNRYWFEQQAVKVVNEVKDGTVNYMMAFLDLDKFKAVNDTGGHLAGDELLRRITALIEESLSDGDSLARLGGDEFAILLKSDDIPKTKQRCDEICNAVHLFSFEWEDHVFSIGVSIGLVNVSKEIKDMTELFRMSDQACYAAKNAGRNQVILYNDDLNR